jgi:hypothetical protein
VESVAALTFHLAIVKLSAYGIVVVYVQLHANELGVRSVLVGSPLCLVVTMAGPNSVLPM